MPRTRPLNRRPFILHNEAYWVYRLFAGERCLYVGRTANLPQRLGSHRSQKPWWPEVDRIEKDMVLTREVAMLDEEHFIRKLQPVHNIVGRGPGSRGGRG